MPRFASASGGDEPGRRRAASKRPAARMRATIAPRKYPIKRAAITTLPSWRAACISGVVLCHQVCSSSNMSASVRASATGHKKAQVRDGVGTLPEKGRSSVGHKAPKSRRPAVTDRKMLVYYKGAPHHGLLRLSSPWLEILQCSRPFVDVTSLEGLCHAVRILSLGPYRQAPSLSIDPEPTSRRLLASATILFYPD